MLLKEAGCPALSFARDKGMQELIRQELFDRVLTTWAMA